jgi:hypothetical protein
LGARRRLARHAAPAPVPPVLLARVLDVLAAVRGEAPVLLDICRQRVLGGKLCVWDGGAQRKSGRASTRASATQARRQPICRAQTCSRGAAAKGSAGGHKRQGVGSAARTPRDGARPAGGGVLQGGQRVGVLVRLLAPRLLGGCGREGGGRGRGSTMSGRSTNAVSRPPALVCGILPWLPWHRAGE